MELLVRRPFLNLKFKVKTKTKKSIKINFYSVKKQKITQFHDFLKAKVRSNFSFIRLPNKRSKVALRKGPSGRGYAVYRKYQLTMHRGFCHIYDLNVLKTVCKNIKIQDLYLQTELV